MKNVLFYCHDFYPLNNGYANAYLNLIQSILKFNDDIHVTVVTSTELRDNDELNIVNLNVNRIKKKNKIKFFGKFINEKNVARFINSLMSENTFDMLFVETFDQPFLLSNIKKEHFSKIVIRVHSTSETEYTFFIPKLVYKIKKYLIRNHVNKKVKWIASTNSFHIEFVKKYYFSDNVIDIGTKSFSIIPNTIFPDPLYLARPENEAKDKIKAVLLGRMEREGYIQKGFEDVFIALNLIEPSLLERLDLLVIGQGEYKRYLTHLAQPLNCVTFIDSMNHDDLILLLQSADLVILPSRFEGLSMFALEGLATGNVCLFSKTGGLIDLIDENGYFTSVQDVYSISNMLSKILNTELKDLELMKLRSKTIYSEKFSNENVANSFTKLLNVITIMNSNTNDGK